MSVASIPSVEELITRLREELSGQEGAQTQFSRQSIEEGLGVLLSDGYLSALVGSTGSRLVDGVAVEELEEAPPLLETDIVEEVLAPADGAAATAVPAPPVDEAALALRSLYALLSSILTKWEDEKIVVSCFRVLNKLVDLVGEDISEACVSNQLVPLIAASLLHCSASPAVCEEACRMMRHISRSGTGREACAEVGAVPLLVSTLQTHELSPIICQEVCETLGNISLHTGASACIQAGAIPALVSTLWMHSASDGVCAYGWRTLAKFVDGDTVEDCITLGAVPILVSTLQKYDASPSAGWEDAYNALSKVASSSPTSGIQACVSAGAISVLLAAAAQRRGSFSSDASDPAMTTLSELVTHDSGKDACIRGDAIRTLATLVLVSQDTDEEWNEFICNLILTPLSLFASTKGGYTGIQTCIPPTLAAQLLGLHPLKQNVTEFAFISLAQWYRSEVYDTASAMAIIPVLLSSLTLHRRSTCVSLHALRALARIALCSPAARSACMEADVISLFSPLSWEMYRMIEKDGRQEFALWEKMFRPPTSTTTEDTESNSAAAHPEAEAEASTSSSSDSGSESKEETQAPDFLRLDDEVELI